MILSLCQPDASEPHQVQILLGLLTSTFFLSGEIGEFKETDDVKKYEMQRN
jgi:hypothetical protein